MAMKKGVLPGEPNPSKPTPRKRNGGKVTLPGRPIPDEPNPVSRYAAVKKAFQTPGIQPGENEYIRAIVKNRGVDRKTAREIGKRRTAKGYGTGGVGGPVKEPKRMEPGRMDAQDPKSAKMPRPRRPRPGGKTPTKGGGPRTGLPVIKRPTGGA